MLVKTSGSIEKLAVFATMFNEDVLGHEEQMRGETCQPTGEGNDKVVAFFLVHGSDCPGKFLVTDL